MSVAFKRIFLSLMVAPPLLAAQADPHAGHHPAPITAAPAAQQATSAGAAKHAAKHDCPMVEQAKDRQHSTMDAKDGKMGQGDMHAMMNKCMHHGHRHKAPTARHRH